MMFADICSESRKQVVECTAEKRNQSHLDGPRLRRFVQRRDSGHVGQRLLNTELPGWRKGKPQIRFMDIARWCDREGCWEVEVEGDLSGLTASSLSVNRQSEAPPGEAQQA